MLIHDKNAVDVGWFEGETEGGYRRIGIVLFEEVEENKYSIIDIFSWAEGAIKEFSDLNPLEEGELVEDSKRTFEGKKGYFWVKGVWWPTTFFPPDIQLMLTWVLRAYLREGVGSDQWLVQDILRKVLS